MGRLTWRLLGVAILGVGTWVVACSAPAPKAFDDGSKEDNATSGAAPSATPTASATGTTPTLPPVVDASVNALPTGPAVPPDKSTPLQVSCGAGLGKLCDKDNRCCWPNFDVATSKCVANNAPEGCGTGDVFDVKCDEKADCPTEGDRCCLGYGETVCTADCFDETIAQGIQICKTDAECDNGDKCADKTCTLGDPGAEKTLKLRVCGTPAECK
jgi:hypothetical protein